MADSFEDRLIEFLKKIDAMKQRANRDQLLVNLPRNPCSNIERHDSHSTDLSNIIRSVKAWCKLSSGKFALEIIMTNARGFVEGLMLEEELEQLISEFDLQVKPEQNEIEIPFVIVAMTQSEVNDLSQKITSNQTDEFKNFQELTLLLQEYGIQNIVSHYSDIREEWKPFTFQGLSIKTVITDIFNSINSDNSRLANTSSLKLIFLSHDCLGEENDKRIRTWDYLRRLGCVIIVDAISLFHPQVLNKLLKAEITSNENVAFLVLSPVNPLDIKANKLLEEIIKDQIEPAFLRFNDLDKLCEIGIGDLRAMKRWFVSVIPETSENITKQNKLKNKEMLSRKFGKPKSVDKLWIKE